MSERKDAEVAHLFDHPRFKLVRLFPRPQTAPRPSTEEPFLKPLVVSEETYRNEYFDF